MKYFRTIFENYEFVLEFFHHYRCIKYSEYFQMKKRQIFAVEFKQESACLVVDHDDSIQETCDTVGVSDGLRWRRVCQLIKKRNGENQLVAMQ